MIKIEKGIPVPEESHRNAMYPFGSMEVGDSFFAERTKSGMQARTAHWRGKLGHLYRVEAWTENGVEGARVWRVK